MENKNNQENDLKQCSIGFRIWIYLCCILINTAVLIFLSTTKLIIIILWPFVRLSLFLECLNLKLQNTMLKEKLKKLSEMENDPHSSLNNPGDK